jgi:ubiquitin carboxyl-terminal hydrolase 36/42
MPTDQPSFADSSQCIICAMSNTLMHTQKNNSGSFTPSHITNRLSQICKHLTLGRQEDAHEFLRYLVEKMEKSFLFRFRGEDLDQYSKETTPLNQILGGYLRSTVTCLSCNHESITFQHFQDLPLDISRVAALSEAISGYFSRENLEECGYKCEACKKRVSAAKRFTLERLPVVLCIQLKRFTAMGGKMSKHIQISERLSLQKYLSKQTDQHQNCSYKFVSMVTHLGGSASGGHYTGNICYIFSTKKNSK